MHKDTAAQGKARSSAFDSAKGTLILLVVLGHLLRGSLEDNNLRAAIYFFHMPLFLAITGYFIKAKLLTSSAREIIARYYPRLIRPFAVAFFLFSAFSAAPHISSIRDAVPETIKSLLYPFYHLWYVPAVIIFIFYIKLLNLLSSAAKLFVLFCFLLLTVIFEGFGQRTDDGLFYVALGDKRFYCLFSFFYLGHYLSARKIPRQFSYFYGPAIAAGLIASFFFDGFIKGAGTTLTNFALITLVIQKLESAHFKESFLSKIGRDSLPIYLWHVAPLIVLKRYNLSPDVYYPACILIMLAFICAIVTASGKSKFLDEYFYGRQ